MPKKLLFLRIPILFLFLMIISAVILFSFNNHGYFVDDFIFGKLLPIIFTSALIILTYIWSVKLLNSWWALLPPFSLTFTLILNPTSTTYYEITAAFFYTAAIYLLILFLLKPNRLNLILTGLYLSLMLFSLGTNNVLILIPYFLILISIFYLASVKRDWLITEPPERFKRFGMRGFRYFRSIIVIFIIGFLLAFIGYEFYKPGPADGCIDFCNPDFFDYYFRYSYYSWKNLTESNINILTSIMMLIKIYWPFIILTASAFIYSFIGIIKSFRASKFKGFWDYLGTSFPEFSMIVFTIMYGGFIIFTSGFNMDKLIPILPMVYILTASGLKKFLMNKL